jgi:hypothetical protein
MRALKVLLAFGSVLNFATYGSSSWPVCLCTAADIVPSHRFLGGRLASEESARLATLQMKVARFYLHLKGDSWVIWQTAETPHENSHCAYSATGLQRLNHALVRFFP